MTVEENSLRKNNYKIFLLITKYLPYLISLCYMLNTLLSLCGIGIYILSIIASMGILTTIYMLSTSIVFKYCLYHRLPIYYVIVNDVINWIDWTIGIPIDDKWFIIISILLMFVTIVLTTILYLKEKKRKR